ncbi:uncharacterized protein [Amphiura filiformis]|uniref:uncharacterized protein n=1 Tax=Amphiura filiformis TaxID=82378 RepID=UPI003B2215E3
MSVFSMQGASVPPATSSSSATANAYSTTMVSSSLTTTDGMPGTGHGGLNSSTSWSNRTSDREVRQAPGPSTSSMASHVSNNNWNGRTWPAASSTCTSASSFQSRLSTTTSHASTCNTSMFSVPIDKPTTDKQQLQSQDSLQGHTPRYKMHESPSQSPSKSPGKDLAAQLLQLVGLPTNLAGRLAPQKFEQKKRVRQTPLISHSVVRTDSPVVPKPGAPLPANLVDDIPGNLPSHRIGIPSSRLTSKGSVRGVTSDSKPTNISGILRNSSTIISNNVKRMSLQDYKSREVSTRTTYETNTPATQSQTDNYITANAQNTQVRDTEGFVIPNASNATHYTPTNVLNTPEKDPEGFVIPNASNTTNYTNFTNALNTPVLDAEGYGISDASNTTGYITANVLNTPEKDAEGFVIPNASNYTTNSKLLHANTSPAVLSTNVENGLVNSDVSKTDDQFHSSSDELDTSLDELVIDESVLEEVKINSPQKPDQQDSDDHNDDDDVPYHPKSRKDINEISMELDELCNNLDTDGTLLMDHKMRKKLRKLMRKQRRREARAKHHQEDKEDDSLSSDGAQQNQHSDNDKDEIDYPEAAVSQQLSEDTEKAQQDDNPKFKTIKHKHIIRKYRQRELEEDKRQKKREKEPLSEGELSSNESEDGGIESEKDSPSKEKRVSQELDLDYWESNCDEEVPDFPNELQITFAVKINAKSQEILTNKPQKKKTLAERSGSFKGDVGLLVDGLFIDSHKHRKSPRRKPSKQHKSPDVIEIYDTQTFLDGDGAELSDISLSGSEGEQEGRKSAKQRHRRKRRRSSKQSNRHSRSRSHSPHRERRRSRSHSPHKGRRKSKRSKSGSRSPSQRKAKRSNSRSPGRYHRRRNRRSFSRSRSRSPKARKHRSRSYSRSPPRKNKDRNYRRNERLRSRSRSRSRSPPRASKDSPNKHSKGRSSRSPSRNKHDERTESQSSPIPVVNDDRNLEDLSMDISSGGDTPPLSIDAEKAEEDEISKQLEAAMAKLKKMEETVSQRQGVIEDLESTASDDESKAVELPADKTDEMDHQLIDAIHRLQKMEESYSQRQMLLNSLRKSILDAEKEAGLNKDDGQESEKEESSDEEKSRKPLPQPSTSAANQQVPTSPTSKLTPSTNKANVPSTSTQPGPSNQPAPKSSRWDKTGTLPANPAPKGNQPAAPVGKKIPSILDLPVVRPPVPSSAQRPPWDPNRPTGVSRSDGLLGTHPLGAPSTAAKRPPVSVATIAPPVSKQQSTHSKHQIVWLVGSSVLCQAARYVAQGPVGLGLMLNQAELVWHGNDNLDWAEFGPLLTRLMGTSISPNVLVVHMDALELAKVSFQDLAQQAVESLIEFNKRNPNCRIIWSEALPCCHYPGSIAKMTMEQVRINYNVMCGKLVLSLGGQVIKHSAIRPETSALFDEDMMHLSDLGNNIFLNNLRRGLAFLLNEPKTKIYCASDDRTF